MAIWGDSRSRVGRVERARATEAATPRPDGRATLFNIQGLRGIAALIVVMAHVSGPDNFEMRVFGSSWTSWSNLPVTVTIMFCG